VPVLVQFTCDRCKCKADVVPDQCYATVGGGRLGLKLPVFLWPPGWRVVGNGLMGSRKRLWAWCPKCRTHARDLPGSPIYREPQPPAAPEPGEAT
jgi:hypothetical protein